MDTSSPEIRILFRFRDLVAATLSEHLKLIEQHGHCWWGWWKRPSEDNHLNVWGELAKQARPKKPVRIGLFDTGAGRVHLAEVIQVIPPKDDSHNAGQPHVPPGEEILVPPYYRDSPFSSAWLKLKHIQAEPFAFFGNYSLAALPHLPNYSEDALAGLQAKVITDPAELVGMDTTIWEVRPRTSNDNDSRDKIILTRPTLPGPISYSPIKATGNTVLHITDLHFADGKHRNQHRWGLDADEGRGSTMIDAISRAVQHERIGVILVTGDLTFLGSQEEYDHARKALLLLLGSLKLDVESLVVVPGNHDIGWTNVGTYQDDAQVFQAPQAATANYRQFYQQVFKHAANAHLSMGRRYLLPSGVALEIAALNSSSLETGKKFLAGMGRVQEAAFEAVASDLKWTDGSESIAFRLLAIHHHLAMTENLEPSSDYYRGFGMAVDAVRIQRLAAKYGVQLALHGHKHRSFIWRSTAYELPEDAQPRHRLGEISIVGGGSAGSTETSANKNFFNLLDFDGSNLRLRIFRSDNGGIFEPFTMYTAPLVLGESPARLILGDWINK